MGFAGPLTVTTPSEREIVVTRQFDAPRHLVFACYTQPPLIRRWLTGMPGWTMPVCKFEPKVGGKYRYESLTDVTRRAKRWNRQFRSRA